MMWYFCGKTIIKMAELRIKEILKAKGMTAKQLAESMGKTPQYLNNIINGGKGASLNTLQEVAKALDMPISSLFADYETNRTNYVICPKCGERIPVEISIREKGIASTDH